MNYHTLLVYHREIRLLVLSALGIFILSGITSSFAQEADSIVLSTNKDFYLPGDTVQLSGAVSAQPTFGVALEVTDSDGSVILNRTVQVDQNGNFSIQFKIPTSATTGSFTVYASALVNGFHVKQTKVFAATVPEFGQIADLVLGFSIVLIMTVFAFSAKLQKLSIGSFYQ